MRGGKLERRRRQDRSTEGAGSGDGVLLPHGDRVWRRAVPQNFFLYFRRTMLRPYGAIEIRLLLLLLLLVLLHVLLLLLLLLTMVFTPRTSQSTPCKCDRFARKRRESWQWKLLSGAENLHPSLYSARAIQPVLQCNEVVMRGLDLLQGSSLYGELRDRPRVQWVSELKTSEFRC